MELAYNLHVNALGQLVSYGFVVYVVREASIKGTFITDDYSHLFFI